MDDSDEIEYLRREDDKSSEVEMDDSDEIENLRRGDDISSEVEMDGSDEIGNLRREGNISSDVEIDNSDEIENLRRKNEALRRELKEATLQLASLAHKEYQVPDGSVRNDYEKICRAIESWIDYACSDQPGDFKNKLREALKTEDKTHQLRRIGVAFGRPATLDPKLDLLKKQDMLHYYILSLTIGRHIFGILTKPYPVGVTESQEIAFSAIEEEMLKIGKAKSKKNQWRSDTLTALCASKSFNTKSQDQLHYFWEDLKEDLSYWLTSSNVSKHRARLQREIFDPAVKLHLEMQCSTQHYEFYSNSGEEDFPYVVKDMTTWKSMASDDTDVNFQCIYPGLAAYDMEAEKKSELVKPVIAVYKQIIPPLAKRSTTSSSNSSPQRTGSLVKESRDYKVNKPTTGTLKGTNHPVLSFLGFNRKAGENQRSPEPASPTSRRLSRDTKSTQSRNHSLIQDQTVNHSQSNQTSQSWPPQASSSTHMHLPAGGTQQYEDEMVEEPKEMEHFARPTR